MSVINGNLISIAIRGERLANTTSVSLDIANNIIEVTTKPTGGYREVLSGVRLHSISFEGIDDSVNPDLFRRYFREGAVIDFRVTFDNYSLVGTGVIDSLSTTGASDEAVTYSGTIVGSGEITDIVPTVKAGICFGPDTICFDTEQIDGPLIQF